MKSGGELKCPAGMVLQTPGIDKRYPNEPAFCVNVTEVDQTSDNRFWAERQRSGFELITTTRDGTTSARPDPQEGLLRAQAAVEIQRGDVLRVEIRPVAVQDKPQPEGKFAGPGKPATLRTWDEAREYCRSVYPGGDLLTEVQWDIACGDQEHCTASGELKHTEARFGNAWENGPVNVDSYAVNRRGTKNMTGNVWEWTLGDVDGLKVIRGGSWLNYYFGLLRADYRDYFNPDYRNNDVGFRCVAPVLSEAEGSPQDSPPNDRRTGKK